MSNTINVDTYFKIGYDFDLNSYFLRICYDVLFNNTFSSIPNLYYKLNNDIQIKKEIVVKIGEVHLRIYYSRKKK